MLSDPVFWHLAVVSVFAFGVGYGFARLRYHRVAQQLITDNKEIALELGSVKVTGDQLERALDNVELLHRSKNQFYSSVSHDLRQPLHALSMFTTVLQKQQLDKASQEIVVEISDAVVDVTRELDVLLNIARVDVDILELRPVEFDLAAETRRIIRQFHRQAISKNLELKVQTFTDDLVYLDRALFDRILRNLIDNAIKFTDKGDVRVTVRYGKGEPILLSVADSGIGISKDDQEGVYREFYQGRNLSDSYLSGVGLGLHSVFKMVSRLGGKIHIESTGISGTNVTLEMHDVKWVGKVSQQSEFGGKSNQVVALHETVLVLESDMLVGRSTVKLLESAGYRAVFVSSLSEAHIVQRTQRIDAACVGLANSEDGSRKLIEALRSAKPDMPIVVMASDDTSKRMYSDLDIVVLLKPISAEKLLDKLAAPH